MNIDIICVGKLKESYLKEAVAEYFKRLSGYCKIKITEVADEKTPDGQSTILDDRVKEIEGERIIKAIKPGSFVILCDLKGKMMDSPEFAEMLNNLGIQGKSDITFVIGGSLGLGKNVLERKDYSICFSKMTFPHQLMRVILLEQIYRGYRIINNAPYHK